jgi:hypothetical protein
VDLNHFTFQTGKDLEIFYRRQSAFQVLQLLAKRIIMIPALFSSGVLM